MVAHMKIAQMISLLLALVCATLAGAFILDIWYAGGDEIDALGVIVFVTLTLLFTALSFSRERR